MIDNATKKDKQIADLQTENERLKAKLDAAVKALEDIKEEKYPSPKERAIIVLAAISAAEKG